MQENGIRPRLVIIVFSLACVSVALSTVLLLSLFFAAPPPAAVGSAPSLEGLSQALKAGDPDKAWRLVGQAASDGRLNFGPQGVSLLWALWQREARAPSLLEFAKQRYSLPIGAEERVLLAYLLLECRLDEAAAGLTRPGEFQAAFPALEAELQALRHPGTPVGFGELLRFGQEGDTRIAVNRAFAYGYLGDFGRALGEARRVVDQTDPPGVNGSGMIDVQRGLCRRQIARTIQILSLWDSRDRSGTPLMQAAAKELLFDTDGLMKAAPDYFSLVLDALAWTGMASELVAAYQAAEAAAFPLDQSQAETKALLSRRAEARPANYRDLRAILSRPASSEPGRDLADLQEAAWAHNDERSFRLLAWELWQQGDRNALRALLEKNRIKREGWHAFYAGLLNEDLGHPEEAREALRAAVGGALEASALLNLARLSLLDDQPAAASNLADEALSLIGLRSLGLDRQRGSAYAALRCDALGLRARLFALEGRHAEGQALLRQIHQLDPQHPALYQATGIAVSPETGMEQTRDPTEE